MIVLMAGLPGTGKSTLAHALASRMEGRVVSKDAIRHAIFAPDEIEYSTRQDDFCMRIMLRTAAYLLEREPSRVIFLDGRTFSRRYQIENVVSAADSLHQPWRILECVCSESTAKARLEEHVAERVHPAANRNFQLYLKVRSQYEAILQPKAVIDTDQALDLCVKASLAAIA